MPLPQHILFFERIMDKLSSIDVLKFDDIASIYCEIVPSASKNKYSLKERVSDLAFKMESQQLIYAKFDTSGNIKEIRKRK